MTVLIVGGRGQGKRELAVKLFDLKDNRIFDGAFCSVDELQNADAIDGLHRLTKRLLQQGDSLDALLPLLRGKIVICDELGCGVVPIERSLEDWREYTGRLCCDLAAEADVVIRVTAGIPQVIKGSLK